MTVPENQPCQYWGVSRIPLRHRLASRLAAWIIGIALALGMVFSLLQVSLDYLDARDDFDKTLGQVLNTLKEPAAQAAYQLNDALAYEVARGLFNYQPIYRVVLLDDTERELFAEEHPRVESSWRWLSDLLFGKDLTYTTPLYIPDEDKLYGRLEVSVDTYRVATGFFKRSGIVIAFGLARNLLLGIIIFALLQSLINRPLSRMAYILGELNPENPEKTRLSCPAGHEKDELGRLAGVINKLLGSIEYRARERENMLRNLAEAAEENAKLFQMASEDSLTGLYIRRYFEVRCEEAISEIIRQKSTLSLLMVDIDHFKSINDTHGHPQGDRVLTEIAQLLKESTRGHSDLVARYGGEEFIVLLPHTDLQGAGHLAERIRQNCEKRNFHTENGVQLFLTLSIGVAGMERDAPLAKEELIRRADQMLYQAKRQGRNRVLLHGRDGPLTVFELY